MCTVYESVYTVVVSPIDSGRLGYKAMQSQCTGVESQTHKRVCTQQQSTALGKQQQQDHL